MLLIADSGSTKTDWVLASPGQGILKRCPTIGFNPYFTGTEAIVSELKTALLPALGDEKVIKIFYYGAGCSTPEKKETVAAALRSVFPGVSEIIVGHDLLASAKALLGDESGFAAIIGTGSNTCLYNGKECFMNIDSLGYLLGDEGSAAYIGKKFVRDFMRKLMEPAMQARFRDRFEIKSNEDILHTLYTKPSPNRYLAGFAAFADEFQDHPYIRAKVKDAFRDFFKNLVSRYPDYQLYSFNCVGSVAFVFRDLLEEVVWEYGMKMGKVIRSPMEDLVNYHLSAHP